MDSFLKEILEKKIEKTIKNLNKNNMEGVYFETKGELLDYLSKNLTKKSKIAVGGSMTLFESGVIDLLRSGNYSFLDRYGDNLTKDQIDNIYLEAFSSDYYFSSANAVTEDGIIYNVDGRGNRVAAIIYGPKKVYIVIGYNKIVKNIHKAIDRNREIAAPTNALRLSQNTPCSKTGSCSDCKSEDRICCAYTAISWQRVKNRISVLIVNEEMGY